MGFAPLHPTYKPRFIAAGKFVRWAFNINNKGGRSMKRILMTSFMVVLSMAFLCLPAGAQPERQENVSAQDLLVKSEVETAVSMLQAIFIKHQKGAMTLEKAKELGADLLRELRYGTDGYFWADTTDGVNVVLYGRKDVEGRNRLEDKDQKGTFYVKEFLEKAKAGGGYVNYLFSKKGQTTIQHKRSYVLLFKPFGWVVGSGYYR
jgi:methyl-accepting chemotaxis protein